MDCRPISSEITISISSTVEVGSTSHIVVVSLGKFEEIRNEYKKVLGKNGQLTKENRQEIEELAYEENFIPTKKGMLLFYHPQANELRAREIHPPDVG